MAFVLRVSAACTGDPELRTDSRVSRVYVTLGISTYKLWLLFMQLWHGFQAPQRRFPTACRSWFDFEEPLMQLGIPVQHACEAFWDWGISYVYPY